jgi:hypothetical protein
MALKNDDIYSKCIIYCYYLIIALMEHMLRQYLKMYFSSAACVKHNCRLFISGFSISAVFF